MNRRTEINGDTVVIEVRGGVDRVQDCISLAGEINNLLEGALSGIVLDLSECAFVTASFCGFIISAVKNAREKGVKFSLVVTPGSHAFEVLEKVHMGKIVDVYPSRRTMARTARVA